MSDITKGTIGQADFPVTFNSATGTIQDAGAAAAIAALATPSGGPGAVLGSTYTAIDNDNGKIHSTPVNCVVTVNTGLVSGFGLGFTGAGVVSFAGSATVVDKRSTGAANPVCSLVAVPGGTYEAWGTKQ